MLPRHVAETLVALVAVTCVRCTGTPGTDAGLDAADDAARFDAADRVSADASLADHAADTATSDIVAADTAPVDPLDPSFAPPIDTNPAHYPANVWVTGPLVKVARDGAPGPLHWAVVAAARNEFESYQVHVRATTGAIQLTVTASDLVDARSGTRITAAAHVFVSREEYLHITMLSDANGVTGYIPDPLIPTQDRYAHEMRNAFPTTVPVGQNRSAWIDVLVPNDAPSGYYTGTVTVLDGSTMLATLPVQLKVWDFALPSTATLRSTFGMSWNGMCVQAYGGYNNCGMYPGANGNADHGTELTHVANATFFLDRRVTIGDAVYAAPTDNNWTSFDSVYGPLMNGTAPTALAGARLTALRYSQGIGDASSITRWTNHFSANGWLPRLFFYVCDEPPNGCTWSATRAQASTLHSASAQARYLLTADIANVTANNLLDGVDIMTPVVDQLDPRGGPNQRSAYNAWLMGTNKSLFWYQSCDEHESCTNGTAGTAASTWPSYMADASPVRNRIFQWLAYVNDIQGELYYASDICWTQACGGQNDPWQSIYAFGGNGDGTLFYPGTPAHIGGSTPVPVSSVRLEHIRDGMEDYEYLQMLTAMGDGAFARTTSSSIITNAYTFDNDPAHYMAARAAIGDRIHHHAHP